MRSPYIEELRRLFVAYAGHDDFAFHRAAEVIIKSFAEENRPGEARYLRDALESPNGESHRRISAHTLVNLSKQSQGLVTFVTEPRSEELFLKPETRSALDRICIEYRSAQRLRESGLRPKARFLFWGPPGCGKTSGATLLATKLSLPLGVVRLGALITSFVGETGSNLQRVLKMADDTPMVLLIDEADAIAKARDDVNDVGELRRVVNALLQGLDYFAPKRSLIILASNHSHLFDPAIWRRFDDVIAFPLPSQSERVAQLKHLASGLHVNGNLETAARKLEGVSFAEIERAVNEVAKTQILEGGSFVSANAIIVEAQQWRAKRDAALGVRKRQR